MEFFIFLVADHSHGFFIGGCSDAFVGADLKS